MKLKTFLALALACCTFAFATAKPELAKTIKFDAPPKALKADVMDALQNRKSAQGFTEKVVSYKETCGQPTALTVLKRVTAQHLLR